MIKIYPDNIFKNNEIFRKERENMTKLMKIEGMMCGHCEMHVKKTLESQKGVTEAVVDHVKGTAVLTLSDNVSNDVLRKAVENEGYKVVSID